MRRLFFLLITSLLSFANVALASETWSFTALDYPPFACQECPENGASIAVLRNALKRQDIGVKITWLPWNRVTREAQKKEYAGYYPAWPEDCKKGFTFSEPISFTPVGFVERKSDPLKFEKLEDLSKYTIGVVQEYGNTVEFNKLVKDGVIKTEEVTTDLLNVRKVSMGRIDGALIDVYVLKHILTNIHPELKNKVQFNPRVVEVKPLGACFKNEVAHQLNEKLKDALKGYNSQKEVELYLKKHLEKLDMPVGSRTISSEKTSNSNNKKN